MMTPLLLVSTVLGVLGRAGAQAPLAGFQCPAEGFHADPDNCALFYRCVSFWSSGKLRAVQFRCKEPAVYDPALTACQFPWKMKPPCVRDGAGVWVREQSQTVAPDFPLPNITVLELGTAGYTSRPPPTYQVAEGSPFACPGPGEHFANIDDSCVFYYQCAEVAPGVLNATLYRCRPGEIFTETTGRCLRPFPVPPCGQSSPPLGRSGVTDNVLVEEEVYDDRDFYLELEFR